MYHVKWVRVFTTNVLQQKKNKPELVKALRFFLIKLLGMKEVSLLLLVQMEIDNVTGR